MRNLTANTAKPVWLFGMLALAANALAQDEAAVDALVQKHMEAEHLPGLAIAVVREGQVLLAKAYGLSDLEKRTPASTETVYEIASVTKMFTAAAVMVLVEAGSVSLEDPITEHLTNLPNEWRTITVRHLLNHTSGLKNYTEIPNFQAASSKDVVKALAAEPLNFAPGTGWSYSNSNYYLLGLLIEKVSGKSYGNFMQKQVFEPLGMKDTCFNDPKKNIKWRAVGYEFANGAFKPAGKESPQRSYAAGALLSTVLDLVKWDAALSSEALLKRKSLEDMWAPTAYADGKVEGYGLGFAVAKNRGRDFVGHGGAISGFSSNFSRFTADQLTVITLANASNQGATGRIGHEIAQMYLSESALTEPKPLAEGRTTPGAVAQPSEVEHAWKSADGRVIQAQFAGMKEQRVLLIRAKQTFEVPLAKLAPESQELARKLAEIGQ